ncbi:MAG: hypothetical protein AAF573_08435 [Bacteroidota bacterium]
MLSYIKLSLTVTLLLFFSLKINAQVEQEDAPPMKQYSIFWNPTALVNPRLPSAMFGMEYRWKPRLAFQQQLGFSILKMSEEGNDFNTIPIERTRIGYRWISEIRQYDEQFGSLVENYYYGLQLISWHYKETGEYRFCRANCQYQQLMDYRIYNTGVGLAISSGYVEKFSKNWTIEYGGSLGGVLNINRSNLPDDADMTGEPEMFDYREPDPDDYLLLRLSVLIYIKLAYTF